MAFTIAEADAINTVLAELVGQRRPETTPERVTEAAAFLADRAHRQLGAGLRSTEIEASAWARELR